MKNLALPEIQSLFSRFVMPTYGRMDIAFVKGSGAYLWDTEGKKYLDLAAGIAVCSLGHAHPEIADEIARQAKELIHVSNLYYQIPQGRLAEAVVHRVGVPGKVFFCNSGGEANEAIFKLARKFGHDTGRYEIITATNSFHGRTLAGIAATGQDKVKKGFEPMVEGFRSVPFNDLEALHSAIGPKTIAVLIEGIQGEGGILPATPEYLLGVRKLCDERGLLFLFDGIQCGYYRSGKFQSFQRILEQTSGAKDFHPDAISMAKGLGAGVPIGCMWAKESLADILGPGTHATTFGGNLLTCSVALKALEIIDRDRVEENVLTVGDFFISGLRGLQREFPAIVTAVRGFGLMLGLEVDPNAPGFAGDSKTPAMQLVVKLLTAGLVTVPAGNNVLRFVPPLNLTQEEAKSALSILANTLRTL